MSEDNMKKLLFITFLLIPAGLYYHYRFISTHLVIARQGSFAAGGRILTHAGTYDPADPYRPDGQTFHGDHAYVFYQTPYNARQYPLVFEHGLGQFSKTWETTPDGRDGFQNIFLKRGFSVYLVDQPRRGRASRSLEKAEIAPVFDKQLWFNRFRVGTWPEYFNGVQFPKDGESLNQYFRQMVPTIGPRDFEVYSDALAAVLEKSGPAILVTHSQGGAVGWFTALKSDKIKAIAAYEPGGSFPFVKEENPTAEKTESGQGETVEVSEAELTAYTKFPIIIYYGDFMGSDDRYTEEQKRWHQRLRIARRWADAVNKRGGDVTVVHLPEASVKGNTHFPFSDLNNVEIADLLSGWLHAKGLD